MVPILVIILVCLRIITLILILLMVVVVISVIFIYSVTVQTSVLGIMVLRNIVLYFNCIFICKRELGQLSPYLNTRRRFICIIRLKAKSVRAK